MPVLKRYNGTDWEVVGEAARPATRGGTLGYAENTALAQAATTETDLPGLSVTVVVPAGRRLRITGRVYGNNTSALNRSKLVIKEGSTELGSVFVNHSEATVNEVLLAHAIVTPSAGSHTYKLVGTGVDGGTSTFGSSTVIPAYILVEDITGTPYVAGEAPPGSTLAYIDVQTNQTGITTEVDITGLATTVTVPDGRLVRLTAFTRVESSIAADQIRVRIKEGSTTLGMAQTTVGSANRGYTLEASRILSPSAGTHSYKVSIERTTGTGSVLSLADPQWPAYLLVEDITGSPMPYNPASVPVGVLAQSIMASDVTGITTTPGIIGTINIAVPAGRTIKLSGFATVQSSNAGEQIYLTFREGGTVLKYMEVRPQLANIGEGFYFEWIFSPSAGAHTYVFDFSRGFSATGTLSSAGADNRRGWLVAEDITPTPAPSSGAPGSTLGYAEVVTNQGSITTTETDLTGLAVTVTVPAGRRIRIRVEGLFQSTVANDLAYLRIKEGSTIYQISSMALLSADAMKKTGEVIITPPAGTHTYKATLARTSGSGNISLVAGATFPAYILVEDITGSVWPEGSPITTSMITDFGTPDTGWIPLTLLNGWNSYDNEYGPSGYSGSTAPPILRKVGKTVYLRGLIKGGSSSSAVIATLPVGFRPSLGKTRITTTTYNEAHGQIDIQGSTGNILPVPVSASTNWLSLNCSFVVD